MGIEGLGEIGQVELEQLAGIDLVNLSITILVANLPLAHGLFVTDILDDFRVEEVKFHLLPQPLVGFGLVDGVIDLVGVVRQILVEGEVWLLLEQLQLGVEPLVVPGDISSKNLFGELKVSLFDLVVKGSGFLLEFLNVGFQKVILGGIEVLDEVVAPLDRDCVVDLGTSHVKLLEQPDDNTGGFLILWLGARGLSPDHYRHQSQNRDQDQWTECDSGHGVVFLI